MTEQTRRLKKALDGCAERGISPTIEPWAEIQVRLGARTATPARRPQRVPKTRAGLVLAAVLVLVFGLGAYAGLPLISDVFRETLPGGDAGRDFGTDIGQERTEGGAKVVLEYAYADAKYVVVGYTVQDTREDRSSGRHPTELLPLQIDDSDRTPAEEAAELPPRVDLTDESGQDFDLAVGSLTHSTGDAGSRAQLKPNVAIFKPAEGLEPGGRQRFRLKVALKEEPVFAPGWEGEIEAPPGGWSNVGPVAFDFEVPVHPVPVVEVGQKETVEGVTMTLKRVFNSPGRPQAVVCFESPDDDHSWSPITAQRDVLQTDPPLPADPLGNGCWSLTLEAPIEGDSTIEVTELYGVPLRAEDNLERRIRGPWTFEVSASETGA